MKRMICAFLLGMAVFSSAQGALKGALEASYNGWRTAVINKDYNAWKRATAEHRQMEVRNRIVSEKRAFPSTVFQLPAPPPSVRGLKFLTAKQNGPTAKSAYFGKIDFGVGGSPSDNLLVLSFVGGKGGWKYDRADFVNLTALPEVRKELAAGNLQYLKETPEAQPNGRIPPTPIAARPAKYIAKVYAFCPGREVKVHVNKISRHRFANTKEAQIVVGGAVDGPNEVQFSTRKLEGSTGKEVMTIRVYLLSQVKGVKPIKVYEYQIGEGEQPKPFGSGTFVVDLAISGQLKGK